MGSLIEEFENVFWGQDKLVVGIDEAGRGPMAGPCMVAAVVFPKGFYHPDINDSKKLSKAKRERLVEIIENNALWYHVSTISEETIDAKNIYRAVQDEMTLLSKLYSVDVILTDAMPLPEIVDTEVHSIIKGDARSMTIAAASILAKTARDKYMIELDSKYPIYGFGKHMGYGTKAHKEAILKYGRTPHHRKTFKFKDEAQISFDI